MQPKPEETSSWKKIMITEDEVLKEQKSMFRQTDAEIDEILAQVDLTPGRYSKTFKELDFYKQELSLNIAKAKLHTLETLYTKATEVKPPEPPVAKIHKKINTQQGFASTNESAIPSRGEKSSSIILASPILASSNIASPSIVSPIITSPSLTVPKISDDPMAPMQEFHPFIALKPLPVAAPASYTPVQIAAPMLGQAQTVNVKSKEP